MKGWLGFVAVSLLHVVCSILAYVQAVIERRKEILGGRCIIIGRDGGDLRRVLPLAIRVYLYDPNRLPVAQ